MVREDLPERVRVDGDRDDGRSLGCVTGSLLAAEGVHPHRHPGGGGASDDRREDAAQLCPVLGLVGAPLLLASDIAILFGVLSRMAPVAALAALPIAVWELSLGVYLTIKGFRPAAVAALTDTAGSAR